MQRCRRPSLATAPPRRSASLLWSLFVLARIIAHALAQCPSGESPIFAEKPDMFMSTANPALAGRLTIAECLQACGGGCVGVNYRSDSGACIVCTETSSLSSVPQWFFYALSCRSLSSSITLGRTSSYHSSASEHGTTRPLPAGSSARAGSTTAPSPAQSTTPAGPGQPGPPGPKGEKGERGAVGPSGKQGGIGFTGATGRQGGRGATGPLGPPGPTGVTGAPGRVGYKGDKGDVGPTGRPGAQGLRGLNGPPGPVGPKGLTGQPGATGPTGLTGATGARGFKGNKGDLGPTGRPGSQGIRGPTGLTGATGYQGFTGPRGPKGDLGPVGGTGPLGQRGFPGQPGPSGPPGRTGATGPVGPSGRPGTKGEPGNPAAMAALLVGENFDIKEDTEAVRRLGCQQNQNGDCEQECIDTDDSYYCACRPGYSLMEVHRKCTVCDRLADIVFIADRTDVNFAEEVLPLLAAEIGVGRDATRIAVIEVGSDVRLAVGLDQIQTSQRLEEELLRLRPAAGAPANLAAALDAAHAHVFGTDAAPGRGRRAVSDIWIMLVANPAPDGDLRIAAQRAARNNVTLIVVSNRPSAHSGLLKDITKPDLTFGYDPESDQLKSLVFGIYEKVEESSTRKCYENPERIYCKHFEPAGLLYCFCRTTQHGVVPLNGTQCQDVDECSSNNGGCTDACVNVDGSYVCACQAGYELAEDGTTCQRTQPVSGGAFGIEAIRRSQTLSIVALAIGALNTVFVVAVCLIVRRRQKAVLSGRPPSPFAWNILARSGKRPLHGGSAKSFTTIDSMYSSSSFSSQE